jgi:hypothetical protein
MRVHLHIDRIVLDGISLASSETARLVRALERELANAATLEAGDLALFAARAIESMASPEIKLSQEPSGIEIGEQLAQSVHAGLGEAFGFSASAARDGRGSS